MPDPAEQVRPQHCEPQIENRQPGSTLSGADQNCTSRQEGSLEWLLRASRQRVSRAAQAFGSDGPIFGAIQDLFGSSKQEASVYAQRTPEDYFVEANSRYPQQVAAEYAKRQGTDRYPFALAIALRGPVFMRQILDILGPAEKTPANPLVQILESRDRIGRGSEVSGPGPSQFLTGQKLAVIIGPEKPNTGYLLRANAERFQRSFPTGKVTLIDFTNLVSGSLQGFDGVLIIAHGEPGNVGWRRKGEGEESKLRQIDGGELAQILLDAGLQRNIPVQFDSCNAGTDRDPDRPGNSVAANFAAVSQGPVLAARADDQMKPYAIANQPYLETISTTEPRLVTPKDFGAFVLPNDARLGSKSLKALAFVYPTMKGVDLSQLFPGAKLMIASPGSQASAGDPGTDTRMPDSTPVHPNQQPMTTWVPGGRFVIVAPTGAMTPYEERGP